MLVSRQGHIVDDAAVWQVSGYSASPGPRSFVHNKLHSILRVSQIKNKNHFQYKVAKRL